MDDECLFQAVRFRELSMFYIELPHALYQDQQREVVDSDEFDIHGGVK